MRSTGPRPRIPAIEAERLGYDSVRIGLHMLCGAVLDRCFSELIGTHRSAVALQLRAAHSAFCHWESKDTRRSANLSRAADCLDGTCSLGTPLAGGW